MTAASRREHAVDGPAAGWYDERLLTNPQPRSNERSREQERAMARGLVSRVALIGVVAGALVAGAWVNVAAAGRQPEYSDSDCEIVSNIEVEGDQSGYYGKTARNASEAFSAAADDIEDEDLAGAMDTLAKVWRKASKGNAIKAARAIGKAGRSYTDALEVYTKALVVCSQRDLSSSDDDSTTSSTDPDNE
jgi:hypothetical protein